MAYAQLIPLLVLLAIGIVAIALVAQSSVHAAHVRRDFGPEYKWVARRLGNGRAAIRELDRRKKRVAGIHIRDLSGEDLKRFRREWAASQSRFVDDPNGAIARADGLVNDVMIARGYPKSDFEGRAADLSVDHVPLMESYRAAHDVAVKSFNGAATTEELRGAMVLYREVFVELLGDASASQSSEARDPNLLTGERRLRHAT